MLKCSLFSFWRGLPLELPKYRRVWKGCTFISVLALSSVSYCSCFHMQYLLSGSVLSAAAVYYGARYGWHWNGGSLSTCSARNCSVGFRDGYRSASLPFLKGAYSGKATEALMARRSRVAPDRNDEAAVWILHVSPNCDLWVLLAIVAFFEFAEKSHAWGLAFLLLAILFNPMIPVYLKRQTWFWLTSGPPASSQRISATCFLSGEVG